LSGALNKKETEKNETVSTCKRRRWGRNRSRWRRS